MVHSLVQAIRRVPWWVWLIAVVALVPRLLLVPFGLPYELNPDERLFVEAAWQMVEGGVGDPDWYNHPASTLMDAMAVIFAGYGALGVVAGEFDSIVAAGDAYLSDVSHFFVIGRLVSVLGGLGVVLMTYAVARELRAAPFWAATAALLMALSFPMIQYSALVRPDMMMSALLLATVLVSLRVLLHPSGRLFALAGVMLGLAAASKYPGGLGIVPIVTANATLTVERRITPRLGLVWLAGVAVAGAAAAFVVGPYLFMNVGDTVNAIGQESFAIVPGGPSAGMLHDLWRYLTEAMPWGLGAVATAVGLAGLVVMLFRRRPRVVSVTFLFFLAFISFPSLWWARWALPLLPLGAIGAAWLLDRMHRRLGQRYDGPWARLAPIGVAALMLWPLLGTTLDLVPSHAGGDDTRLRANTWVYENIQPGSTILVDSYSVQVPADDYDIRVVDFGEIVSWPEYSDKVRPDGYFDRLAGQWIGSTEDMMAAIEAAGIEYIALSDIWIDLFRAQADEYPQVVERYETILETYPVIARFDSDAAPLGAPVTILAGPGPAPVSPDD